MVAPEIEVDAEVGQFVTVRAGGVIRLFSIIRGRPTPTAKWCKENGKINELAQVETTSYSTLLIINDCTRDDAGKYVLTLENTSGSKTVSISVKVLDTPGPVQNLKVSEVTREYVILNWDMPSVDGGAVISNYIVEKRESTRKAYHAVGSTPHRTSFKVTGLTEGDSYFFRVLAENEHGVGIPCETAQAVKVSEAPSPPEQIKVEDVTDTSVTLSWTKPEHDGGSPITTYVVECIQKGGFESWLVCGSTKNTRLVINKLNTGKDYMFRVRAQNVVGVSDGRETNTITIREVLIPPTIDTTKYFNNTISEKGATDIYLHIPYFGKPLPQIPLFIPQPDICSLPLMFSSNGFFAYPMADITSRSMIEVVSYTIVA